jgi:hypothetical protein
VALQTVHALSGHCALSGGLARDLRDGHYFTTNIHPPWPRVPWKAFAPASQSGIDPSEFIEHVSLDFRY